MKPYASLAGRTRQALADLEYPAQRPVTSKTTHLLTERIDQLQHLFPEVFAEGKIDWDKLRAALGDCVDERSERYSFTWTGKREAIRLLQAPSRARLIPARDESVERLAELVADDRIWFGPDGNGVPVLKRFLSEVKPGFTSLTIWKREEVGDMQDGRRSLRELFGDTGSSSLQSRRAIPSFPPSPRSARNASGA